MIDTPWLIVVAPLVVASLWGWGRVLSHALAGRAPLEAAPRRPVPWTMLDLCFCVAVWLLLQFVGDAMVRGAFYLNPAAEPDELPLYARAALMLAGGTATLLTTLISLLAVMWHTRATWRDVGFDERFFGSDLRLGLTAFILLAPPVYAVHLLMQVWFPYRHPLWNLLRENPDATFLAISAFTALIVAPLCEEYFFRVLLQGWLHQLNRSGEVVSSWFYAVADKPAPHESAYAGLPASDEPDAPVDESPERIGETLGVWPIFASALAFSFVHMGSGPIPLFLLALGLGYLYRQTHRILPCIMVHVMLNACSLAVLLIELYRPG
jgi:membrane protease YdiL (CAAX protease family)